MDRQVRSFESCTRLVFYAGAGAFQDQKHMRSLQPQAKEGGLSLSRLSRRGHFLAAPRGHFGHRCTQSVQFYNDHMLDGPVSISQHQLDQNLLDCVLALSQRTLLFRQAKQLLTGRCLFITAEGQ